MSNKTILIVTLIFSFLVSAAVSFAYFRYNHYQPQASQPDQPILEPTPAPSINVTPVPPPTNTVSIALLGHGDQGHQGGYLTDAMLVAYFNSDTNTYSLITIPRDTWINFPDGNLGKINTAFVKDTKAATVAKRVLGDVTGLPINYYAEVDFFGITAIVDELNGITIELEEGFEDPWYPIRGREQDPCGKTPEEIADLTNTLSGFELEKQFECRYETVSIKAGRHKIDGATALKLARSRHSGSNGSDFSRSQRQQAILLGIAEKILSQDGLSKAPEIFTQLSHTFRSDIDLGIIAGLADLLTDFQAYRFIPINLSTQNVFESSTGPQGQFILIPKDSWAAVHQYVAQQLTSPNQ